MPDTTLRPRRAGFTAAERSRTALERLAPWAGLTVLAAYMGAASVGETDRYLGSTPTLLSVAALSAAATFVVFGFVGYPALLAWPILTGIAYPFVKYPSGDPLVSFDRLWIVGLAGVIMLATSSVLQERESRFLLTTMLVLTAVFGLRTATTSGATLSTFKVWIDAIILPAILLLATVRIAVTQGRIRAIAGALMLGGGVLALLGLADLVVGLNLESYVGTVRREELGVFRLAGPYGVPEPYGLSLVVCLAATGYWLYSSHGGRRIFAASVGLLQLTAIGLTLFRAAWIAAVLVIITTFGLRRGRIGRLLFAAAVTGIFLAAALSQLSQTDVFSHRVENTDNIYGRLATYKQGLGMFRSSPIAGIGVEHYHDYAEQLRPESVNGVLSVTYAHSSFVWLLAEQGLLGFVPLLVVCAAAARLIRALARRARAPDSAALAGAAAGAALGYLVMSLTLTMLPYGPSNAFFAVLLGLVAAQLNLDARRSVVP